MAVERTLRGVADAIRISRQRKLLRDSSLRGGLRLLATLLRSRRLDFYLSIDVHRINRPEDLAITDETGSWTWRDLAEAQDGVAGALHASGVRPGQKVAIYLANRREHVAASAGIRAIGAVPMPLSPHSAAPQVIDRITASGAVCALVEPALADAAITALGRSRHRVVVVGEDAPARAVSWSEWIARGAGQRPRGARLRKDVPDLVLHTSGTTGRSKSTGVSLASAGVDNVFHYLERFDFDPDAVVYTPCPLYHAAPMFFSWLTLLVGGHLVLRQRHDDAAIDEMIRHGVSHVFMVPTLLGRLSRSDPDALARLRRGPLRALISGGATLRPALQRTLLEQLGPVLYDFYGATELGLVSIASPGDLACRPGTVGAALPSVQLRLIDDEGDDVPTGEPGELFVQSDTMTQDGSSRVPGWVSAGDVARIDEGYLYIVDRKRDLVISGGVNVFPVDVEIAVERHPAVREAAVVGLPDEEWGEALHCFVVLEDGQQLDPAALKEHCKTQLQPYAIPKRFEALDDLPRSHTGKVLRRSLRERAAPS